MNRIIRVFPYRTSYTPIDDMVFIGNPPFKEMIPDHDEVHISCTFTWDREICEELKYQWQSITDRKVKLGGVAYGNVDGEFIQGMYVAPNIIFTSRGCNNGCSFCGVPKNEGGIKELPICEGNVIQDNNFLQTSIEHKNKVFEMLKRQHGICFKGGLQADLIDDHFINAIQELSIKELWLACDNRKSIKRFIKGCLKLVDAGFNRNKIYCYVLIGDDIQENEDRLKTVFNTGAMPFAQLYQPFENKRKKYSKEWECFQRKWSRPAIIKSMM